jgi:hypothetical protein
LAVSLGSSWSGLGWEATIYLPLELGQLEPTGRTGAGLLSGHEFLREIEIERDLRLRSDSGIPSASDTLRSVLS